MVKLQAYAMAGLVLMNAVEAQPMSSQEAEPKVSLLSELHMMAALRRHIPNHPLLRKFDEKKKSNSIEAKQREAYEQTTGPERELRDKIWKLVDYVKEHAQSTEHRVTHINYQWQSPEGIRIELTRPFREREGLSIELSIPNLVRFTDWDLDGVVDRWWVPKENPLSLADQYDLETRNTPRTVYDTEYAKVGRVYSAALDSILETLK